MNTNTAGKRRGHEENWGGEKEENLSVFWGCDTREKLVNVLTVLSRQQDFYGPGQPAAASVGKSWSWRAVLVKQLNSGPGLGLEGPRFMLSLEHLLLLCL